MSTRRIILLIVAVAAITSVIGFGVLSKRIESQRQKVTTIPPVYSKVKTLEVVSTKIINENTPAAGVSVEIRNNSYKSVMAVDLVCGEGAITKNGLTDEENPIVVIEPYGVTTVEMAFGAMSPNAPLVVSAVTYDDGTEEGDEESLRIMHKIRDHDRAKLQEARTQQKERKP
jgi:hypothetical protein